MGILEEGCELTVFVVWWAVSMLHGRGTGGLQVLPKGSSDWQWIRPIDGYAVCNVGDTLSVYTGGIL